MPSQPSPVALPRRALSSLSALTCSDRALSVTASDSAAATANGDEEESKGAEAQTEAPLIKGPPLLLCIVVLAVCCNHPTLTPLLLSLLTNWLCCRRSFLRLELKRRGC